MSADCGPKRLRTTGKKTNELNSPNKTTRKKICNAASLTIHCLETAICGNESDLEEREEDVGRGEGRQYEGQGGAQAAVEDGRTDSCQGSFDPILSTSFMPGR